MMRHHRVAVVFDEHAHDLLTSLAATCHVWLVASEKNTALAREYWKRTAPLFGQRIYRPGVALPP